MTRLSELTVDQFVQLLAQVLPQIRQRRAGDHAEIERVLAMIRKSMAEGGGERRDEVAKSVRDVQLSIVDQMPELLRRICG